MSARPRRPRPATRAAFMALEEQVWAELAATWRGLPEPVLLRGGASGSRWSIKDVMNHIATWLEATRRELPTLTADRPLAGRPYRIALFNDRHYAQDRARSLSLSRVRLNRARRGFLAAVQSLPEKKMLDLNDRLGRWVKYATYGHYDEHLPALREYRKRWAKK